MSKHRSGLTRQGVRDLNFIKGKSVGIRLPEVPAPVLCAHKNKKREVEGSGITFLICKDCDTVIDEW